MKKLLLCLISFSVYAAEVPQPADEATQLVATQSDLLSSFDSVPDSDQPIQERPLPWVLNVIQKPAAFILIKACHSWDWVQQHYAALRTKIAHWRTNTQLKKNE